MLCLLPNGNLFKNIYSDTVSLLIRPKTVSLKVCGASYYSLDNIFIRSGFKLYKHIVRIPIGTYCAPLVVDLFLFCNERDLNVCDALTYLLDNFLIRFGTKLYRQVVGIPMGSRCAPMVADLFLFCSERDLMMSLSDDKQTDIVDAFNTIS